MSSNEIYIAKVADRYMSFTLEYKSNPHKSCVEVIVGAHSLDSYNGAVDLSFEDLTSAVSYFRSLGDKSCVRYELILGYRIKV